ncbi:type I-E CRISPR-associated endoribonuclease Cas2e [Nocardia sp. NPDC051787]|uniref:type I-E CRISPR-associated endoribonuclease Cas2e n=1 Tax=Nocardia sp. NPDC051787 TaxID=3155415 RepID=UPI0034351370
MTIVVLTAVPPGLRGHLTRWLLEISPGVFVGHISPRVRDLMWQRVVEFVAEGRAIMVHSARNEQRLAFQVHGHDWTPVDHDGLMLMRRKTVPDYIPATQAPAVAGSRTANNAEHQSETVWRRRAARRKFKPK